MVETLLRVLAEIVAVGFVAFSLAGIIGSVKSKDANFSVMARVFAIAAHGGAIALVVYLLT